MNFILVGAPGSGKGTLYEELVQDYNNFVQISTGDLFRNNIKNNTEIGQIAKGYIDRGELVPDDVVLRMLKERMEQDDCKNGHILLDGYPRNLEQVKALDTICKIDLVFYLNASAETVIGRVCSRRLCPNCKTIWNVIRDNLTDDVCKKCGAKLEQRADDTEEAIKKRLNVFFNETLPIIDEYKKRGILVEIDANPGQKYTYKMVRRVLDEKLK